MTLFRTFLLILAVLLVLESKEVPSETRRNGHDTPSINGTSVPTRKTPEMPKYSNGYRNVLERTVYVIVAVSAVAVLYFVIRAVRAARRKAHSQGRSAGKRKTHHLELEPLALGGDDDDDNEDMTIYDASKL